MIELVVSAHSLPARAKSIRTLTELDVDLCWAEPTLLERVIDNLYSNAVHYGAESGTIWIRSRLAGDKIQIDVANTGAGIPSAEQAMILNLFIREVFNVKAL